MRIRAGTSGFAYDEWKGPFYPADLDAAEMLAFYSERLSTVEINNTFYRSPKREVVRRWGEQVPANFTFVLKAPRRITHQSRLVDTQESVSYFWQSACELGERLGPILFQLPPNLRADPPRLATFLSELPAGCRAALEVRHASWLTPEVNALLAEHGAALCIADAEDLPAPAIAPTARFGYFRLRRPDYDDAALTAWIEKIRAQPWDEAFVFFKHEDQGAAPHAAARFLELAGASGAQ